MPLATIKEAGTEPQQHEPNECLSNDEQSSNNCEQDPDLDTISAEYNLNEEVPDVSEFFSFLRLATLTVIVKDLKDAQSNFDQLDLFIFVFRLRTKSQSTWGTLGFLNNKAALYNAGILSISKLKRNLSGR